MSLILDVSDYQPTIDWKTVRRAGVEAVWIKATEGLSFNATLYATHKTNANAAGIRTGAYHFARPDSHPKGAADEAAHFAAVIGKPARRDLRPVLDFETWSDSLTAAQHVAWARQFNAAVKARLGMYPVFYSYSAFIDRMQPTSPIGAALWLANYNINDGQRHKAPVPAPWKNVQAHQFTSNYRISGIQGGVDMSYAPKLQPLLAYPWAGLL